MKYKYKVEVLTIFKAQQVKKEMVNGISFTNRGTGEVLINNFSLPAGETFSVSGNHGEIDETPYDVRLKPGDLGTLEVRVLMKQYQG